MPAARESEDRAALSAPAADQPTEGHDRGTRYATSHGFTPHVNNPFSDGTYCRVMLARYVCPYGREEHDPAKPPEDVDAFGYRRTPRATKDGACDHTSHFVTEDDGRRHWRCLRCGQVTEQAEAGS